MNLAIWLPALACVSLVIYIVLQRTSARQDKSTERLALLVGARRAWGESDASLKRRSIALSRWPYKEEKPDLAWWARLAGRIWRPSRTNAFRSCAPRAAPPSPAAPP